MKFKIYSLKRFQFEPFNNSSTLVLSVALSLSIGSIAIQRCQINNFRYQPIRSHLSSPSVIIPNQKQCTRCGAEKNVGEFYSKGDRVDARCKSCVLSDKRTKRIEVKRTKIRRPRGRVIDLRQFTVSATNLREAEPKAVQLALHEWIELVLGG